MSSRILSLLALVSMFIAGSIAGCGDNELPPGDGSGGEVTLEAIRITPVAPELALGTKVQLIATATYSDDSTADVTTRVTWSSSASDIVVISADGAPGLAKAAGRGAATITATLTDDTGHTVSGSTMLTVLAADLVTIEVTPTNTSIAKGTTAQLTATAIYTDNTTMDVTAAATWSSSDAGIASITAGLTRGVAAGTVTVTAELSGVSGSTQVTVTAATLATIEVSPAAPSIAVGAQLQFTATATFTDATTQDVTAQATWSSSKTNVADVSDAAATKGLATANAAGTTTVTATLGSVSGSTVLTVTRATLDHIQVTPASPNVAKGTTVQFVAEGVYSDGSIVTMTDSVTWTSSSTAVAMISNAAGSQGSAFAAAAGTTTITATDPVTGMSGQTTLTVTGATLVSIEVDPARETLPRGTGEIYTATGIYSDFSTQDLTTSLTWASSNPAAATISNAAGTEGNVTTLAAGTTTITATDPASGVVGSAQLTVGRSVLLSMRIEPANPTIGKGARLQFQCIGTYDDGTTRVITQFVTWDSSKTNVASVSNAPKKHGLAQSKLSGTTTITATDPTSGVSATTTLTVTSATLASITIAPANQTIPNKTKQAFTATGVYSDGSTSDFTSTVAWSSSNVGVATISNQNFQWGIAAAVSPGTTTITATDTASGVAGSTTLTVSNATLVSIALAPANPTVIAGLQQQMTATGTFSDGSTKNITAEVTWLTGNANVATVLNIGATKGTVTGVAAGSTTISAAFPQSSTQGQTTVTVIP